MEFFLDSASLKEIEKWSEFGLVDGVTTNPTLLAREGREALSQLKQIASRVKGPVSAQVTFDQSDRMIQQGFALSELADNIIVKVPATEEGFRAAKVLAPEGVKCNVTLTFDPAQAVAFCRLPVAYVSLIIGRVEDFGLHGLSLAQQLRNVIDRLDSPTRLLAASIRNSHHLLAAMAAGADVLTVPPSTWVNVFSNPLTLSGEKDFFSAWRSLPHEMLNQYESLQAKIGSRSVK